MTSAEIYWNELLILSARIALASFILPIVIGLWFKKRWNRPLFVAFLYVLFTVLINLFEQILILSINTYPEFYKPYLAYWEIDNTSFLLILYHLKNFLLLGWFFSLIFPISPYDRYIFRTGIFLAAAALLNYCFMEGYKTQGVFNSGADAIFAGALPLIYLWYSQGQSLRIPLIKNPYLWISLGLLVPNLLGLFLFFAGGYIQRTDFILFAKINIVKNVFEIIGQLLIAIGFYYSRFTRFIQTAQKPE